MTSVAISNADASGRIVLVCEHASNHVPARFARLGLSDATLASHIAWDPGALAVSELLRTTFDAPLVAGTISRLVYDCNRPPEAPSAMVERTDSIDVPGNKSLDAVEQTRRVNEVYRPFERALATLLDSRPDAVMVTVHSFNPVHLGRQRDVEIGVLHDADSRLADALLATMQDEDFDIRRNEPYGPQDGVTHTLKHHALPRGRLNVMLEVRNDLIADPPGQERIAAWLAARIDAAITEVAAAHA